MPEHARVTRPTTPSGDPSPQTCLQVAAEAALLAIIAADDAMAAACRSRSANSAHLETAILSTVPLLRHQVKYQYIVAHGGTATGTSSAPGRGSSPRHGDADASPDVGPFGLSWARTVTA
jgi:hypothetical protein